MPPQLKIYFNNTNSFKRMTKIKINKTKKPLTDYKLGDWVLMTNKYNEEILCVIAQVSEGMMANIIAIGDNDANRLCSEPIEWNIGGGTYNNLSDSFIKHFTKEGYTIKKVNVTIEATEV